MPRPGEDRSNVGGAAQFTNIGPVPLSLSDLSRFPLQRVAREGWAEIKMPRPGEDRSDVGGTAQFTNIGPVPLSPALSRFLPLSPQVNCRGWSTGGFGTSRSLTNPTLAPRRGSTRRCRLR